MLNLHKYAKMFYRVNKGGIFLKLFDIVYEKDNKQEILNCSEINLEEYKKWVLEKEGKIIDIKERPLHHKPKKTMSKDDIEKGRYYSSKYIAEKRRLDKGKISKKEFEERKKYLKSLRRECNTRIEYKKRYESMYK